MSLNVCIHYLQYITEHGYVWDAGEWWCQCVGKLQRGGVLAIPEVTRFICDILIIQCIGFGFIDYYIADFHTECNGVIASVCDGGGGGDNAQVPGIKPQWRE